MLWATGLNNVFLPSWKNLKKKKGIVDKPTSFTLLIWSWMILARRPNIVSGIICKTWRYDSLVIKRAHLMLLYFVPTQLRKKIANRRGMFTIMPKRDEYLEKSESYSNLTSWDVTKNLFCRSKKNVNEINPPRESTVWDPTEHMHFTNPQFITSTSA